LACTCWGGAGLAGAGAGAGARPRLVQLPSVPSLYFCNILDLEKSCCCDGLPPLPVMRLTGPLLFDERFASGR
jgi:hypothetical protein